MNDIANIPETFAEPRKVDQLLTHYGESHRHPRNELIHFIAIPLIMLSLVGMLFALHPYVAYVFVAASMVYYARLSAVFFMTMAVWSVLFLGLVFTMGPLVLPICIGIFVGAWVLQFIGHKIEGKKPSFFEDIQYLWVGPLFVLSKLFARLGIRW
ncbi:Mpo1-like protein [Polaromonas sp.]|uniref:Mpo1 family 2-hydroxy fatty acid dioxygenase n=1 Tax=Polaromonas sp. TaxID=1869339 RepID=UPI0032642150